MGHTAEDWSWMGKVATIYSLQDMAELAARLGSIDVFDRRGNVLLLDNFENGLAKVLTNTSGTGASVAISVAEARFGAYSAKLTGGSTASRFALIRYYLPVLPLSELGAEFSFRVAGNVEFVKLALDLFTGTMNYFGALRYDVLNDKWQYWSTAPGWADLLTSVVLLEQTACFHLCKLVIDPTNEIYTRAVFSGQQVDMSSYAIVADTDTTTPQLKVDVVVYSESGANGVCYVDSVIITQNEP